MSSKVASMKSVKSVKSDDVSSSKKKSKVSVNTANIDPSLLEMVQSGSDETTEIVAVKKTTPSKQKVVKARCRGCIDKKCINEAYSYLINNEKILKEDPLNGLIIVDTDKPGSYRIYGCCSRAVSGEGPYCSQHSKKENVFNFEDVFINESVTDVITHDFEDLDVNHPVFEKLNKNHGGPVKGKSKKTQKINTTIEFNVDDPVFGVLNHRNPILAQKLRVFALDLIKKHDEISRQKKDKFEDVSNMTTSSNSSNESDLSDSEDIDEDEPKNNVSSILKSFQENDNNNINNNNNNAVDYGSDVDADEVNQINNKRRSTTPPRSTITNKSIEYLFENNNEDDGEDYEEIEKDDDTLFYYPKSLVVYKPNEEGDDMDPIGKLIPILEKDSCITWKGKHYTALFKEKIDGNDVLVCRLDNKIFDFYKKHIGNITKMNGRKIVSHKFF